MANRADRRTNARRNSNIRMSRKFHPSQFQSFNQRTSGHDTYTFYYNNVEMVWTAEYRPVQKSWQLVMSYADYSGNKVSEDELNAFLQECGMVKDAPINAYTQNSSFDGTLLHYYVQTLPEQPLQSYSDPLCLVLLEDQGMMPLTPETFNELLSFNPDRIRKATHNMSPNISDESAIIFAHKIIAKSPYSTGTQKINSINWLHNRGFRVNMGMS